MKPLPELVGKVVDVYLRGQPEPIKGATVEYIRKSWVGISFVYRRVQHQLHCPVSAISKIDHKTRIAHQR
ncbi:MAG: hypothetical protein H6707_18550 [Deltaproteobacteria bacterium]|nr:hypothetical protein [Deltaproteobacteria bacterium]